MARSAAPRRPATAPSGEALVFLGDVYLPAPVDVEVELPGALAYNLEAPITRETRGWPGTVNLKTEADHAVATFGRQPLAVCLANNHIMDYGPTGLAETLTALRAAGTVFFGAGRLDDDCHNPAFVNVGERRVALCGYVCPTTHPVFATAEHPGVAPIDQARIAADIAAARAAGADRVIVHLHWGIEEVGLPRPQDVVLARAIADAGADLVIGHHAHCVQPYETHHGVPIYYGLGNAIFPDVDVPASFDGSGEPRERYRKLQNYWNRPSLAVRYDPVTGEATTTALHFDGRSLRAGWLDMSRLRLEATDLAAFERRFQRHLFRATWRKKLVNYARRPRLPRPRHLRSLLQILRESRARA